MKTSFFDFDNEEEYKDGSLDCVYFKDLKPGDMFFGITGERLIKLGKGRALHFGEKKEWSFGPKNMVYFWGNQVNS